MLRLANHLKHFSLGARDGDIGKVNDFYFDDAHWVVRYLVADTGKWIPGRLVLISPNALRQVDESKKRLALDLTQQQIKDSPPIQEHETVSRQFEINYFQYYGWPMYWEGPWLWGPTTYPVGLANLPVANPPGTQSAPPVKPGSGPDAHLRSMREVTGYRIHARDGELGHVDEFVVDDRDWAIRYLVVDTRNWWPGKHVLVSPDWASDIRWSQSEVVINLDRQTIKDAPEFTKSTPLTAEYERRLLEHYQPHTPMASRT